MKYLDNSGLAKVIEKLRNEIKANSNEKIIIGTSFTSFGDGETKTMQELTNAFFGDTTHTPQELIDTLKRIWNEGIPAYFQNNNTLVHRNYPVTVMHLNPTKYYFIYFDGNSGSIKNIYIPYLSADATATTTISKKTMDIRVNDNLTNTSTTTPLSANQGKVLNDKIEAMKPVNSLISDSTEASLAAAAGKTLNDKIEELAYTKFFSEEYSITTNTNFILNETNKEYTATYPESTTGNYNSSLIIKPNKTVSKLIIDIASNLQSTSSVSITKGSEILKDTLTSEQLIIENPTISDNINITVTMTAASETYSIKVTTLEEDLSTDLKFLSVTKESEPFIPTENWQPTTKEYVDNKIKKIYYVPENFISLSSEGTVKTAQEWANIWFGDETHSYADFINVLDELNEGDITLLFKAKSSTRVYNVSYSVSKRKRPTWNQYNNLTLCIYGLDHTYTIRFGTFRGNSSTSSVFRGSDSHGLTPSIYQSKDDDTELYPQLEVINNNYNLYNNESIILENASINGGNLAANSSGKKVLLIKVNKYYSNLYFSSNYIKNNATNSFGTIYNFDSSLGYIKSITPTANEDNTSYNITSISSNTYLGFQYTNDEEIEKFTITTNGHISSLEEKAERPTAEMLYSNSNEKLNLGFTNIKISNTKPSKGGNIWIKRGIKNLFNKEEIINNKRFYSDFIDDITKFCIKLDLKANNIYQIDSKYATLYSMSYKQEGQTSFTGGYTFNKFIKPTKNGEYYFSFGKNINYSLEEQLDNIIITENMGSNNFEGDTEIYLTDELNNYYLAGKLKNKEENKISTLPSQPINNEKIWIKNSNNIFNPYKDKVLRALINNNGILSMSNSATLVVKCKPNTQYSFTGPNPVSGMTMATTNTEKFTNNMSLTKLTVSQISDVGSNSWCNGSIYRATTGEDAQYLLINYTILTKGYSNYDFYLPLENTAYVSDTISETDIRKKLILIEGEINDIYPYVENEILIRKQDGNYYSLNFATKDYVDNQITDINLLTDTNTLVYNWDFKSSSENPNNLTMFQEIVDKHYEGKNIIIIGKHSNYGIVTFELKSTDTPASSSSYRVFQLYSNYVMSMINYNNNGYTKMSHQRVICMAKIGTSDTIVTEVSSSSAQESKGNYIDTSVTYNSAFVPTQDYHPATKKYVDDKINPIDFNKVYELSWATNESDTSKNGYIMPIEGLTSLEQIRDKRIPFIAKVMGDYVGTSYGLSLTSTPQGSTGTAATLYAPIDSESITLSTPGKVNYITFTNKNGTDCFVIDNDRKDLTLSLYFMTSTTTSYTTIDSVITNLGIETELELAAFLNALEYRPIPVTFKGRLSSSDGYGSFNGSISGTVARASGKIRKMKLTMYAHTKIYNALVTVNTSDSTVTVERKVIDLAELAGVLGGSY